MASRRSSEELIFEGRVTVNGSVCNTPQARLYFLTFRNSGSFFFLCYSFFCVLDIEISSAHKISFNYLKSFIIFFCSYSRALSSMMV